MQTSPTTTNHPALSLRLVWILALLGLAAYFLPALANKPAALTAGAYDLAEWASLTPGGRTDLPFYLPTLFLRLQPVVLAYFVAVNTPRRVRTSAWVAGLVCVLAVSTALLPPLTFLSADRNDPNYLQQFGIALLAVIGGLGLLSGKLYHLRDWFSGGFAVIGAVSSITGILQVQGIMQQYGLAPGIGAGGVLLPLIHAVMVLGMLRQLREYKQGSMSIHAAPQ